MEVPVRWWIVCMDNFPTRRARSSDWYRHRQWKFSFHWSACRKEWCQRYGTQGSHRRSYIMQSKHYDLVSFFYQEILLTSSFMTPLESRDGTQPNRVRCFGKTALVPEVAEQKWDVLKVICTQPFNKYIQYGLSFVKLHAASTEAKPLVPAKFLNAVASPIAGFKMREDSPDSDGGPSSSSLFSRWKQSKGDLSQTSSPISGKFIQTKSYYLEIFVK